MNILPREGYDHPGRLGFPLDLSRVTGWDFHHTAGNKRESPKSVAQTGVNRFGRSSYNFLISQEWSPGDVYEMQGLHVGAHNDGENSTRLGVVFPGYYHPSVNDRLTPEQIDAAAALVARGYEAWGVPMHGKGHRDPDLNPDPEPDYTACPGDHVHAQISTIISKAEEIVMGTVSPWAQESWDWAKRLGLVNEDTDPKDPLNKEELVAFLKRYHDKADKTGSGPNETEVRRIARGIVNSHASDGKAHDHRHDEGTTGGPQ